MTSDGATGSSGGGAPSHDRPSAARLSEVWTHAEALIVDIGGTEEEAHTVARDMNTYLEVNWVPRRLRFLARDSQLWDAFITRKIIRRWLVLLHQQRGNGDKPRQSLARKVLLGMAQRAAFSTEDYELVEHICLYGFTVAETAVMFDLEVAELTERLRLLWAAARGGASS